MTEIEHLLGLVDPLVRQYGLIAVPVITTLESLGAPLPSESLPILASVMAEHGSISFPLADALCLNRRGPRRDIGYLTGRRAGLLSCVTATRSELLRSA
jgi:membrane protein DedA with SNARE-associated domain